MLKAEVGHMYVCRSRQQQYKKAEKKELWSFLLLLPLFAAKREMLPD
jgi:hypothetical protein